MNGPEILGTIGNGEMSARVSESGDMAEAAAVIELEAKKRNSTSLVNPYGLNLGTQNL